MDLIPFNRAALAGRELEYIQQAVAAMHLSGDGQFTRKCHQALEARIGAPKVLLTTSCTHALEMTALLLGLTAGDEVILPSFTFVSTANAFVLRGARPVFADIRPDTLNIDPAHVERLVTSRTKAIVVVHYAGVACDMDAILSIAGRHGLAVVEDNAHGLFGSYKGRPLGSIGDLATLSFHETKNITCGEGGALVVNRRDLIERAEIIREKGTDRSRFFRGQVDKYSWQDVGSSYLPSEILAAFLYAQLELADRIQARRQAQWERYRDELSGWALEHEVQLPHVPAGCEQPSHLFYMVMPSAERRRALIEGLKERGVMAIFHYLPLHLSPMGQKYGGQPGDCPVTERVSDCLVRLPLAAGLTDEEQTSVVSAIKAL